MEEKEVHWIKRAVSPLHKAGTKRASGELKASASTHYLTNLTDKLKTHMHNRHKLGSADLPQATITIAGRSSTTPHSPLPLTPLPVWNLTNPPHAMLPTPPDTTASSKPHDPPSQLANKEINNSSGITQRSP
eukprot:1137007-Pelagomonas_calceolata.AAC.5